MKTSDDTFTKIVNITVESHLVSDTLKENNRDCQIYLKITYNTPLLFNKNINQHYQSNLKPINEDKT